MTGGGVDADLTHRLLERAKEKKLEKPESIERYDTRTMDCNGEYQK